MRLQSLRARLIVIILTPLLMISIAAGAWQFRNATVRAEEIFDRGLLSAALAISRDVAASDGDALSVATRQLIRDTSGGELFYHVYAPDGVFVIGYATPPVAPTGTSTVLTEPLFYNAHYQGREVRVLRVQDVATVSGMSGIFTFTVWQNMEVRSSFVRESVTRSFAVIAVLVVSVALVVWFGVRLGLRPLLDLEEAISKRTPTELEPIRRAVPVEAHGLVSTLNALLDRVSRQISSKDAFISNAAHQLRNPIAGVLALAESVQSAPDVATMKSRSVDLVEAARDASLLTNQLLSFERAKGTDMTSGGTQVDFSTFVRSVIDRFVQQTHDVSVELICTDTGPVGVLCDEVMMREALINLLNNSVVHGGIGLTRIEIALSIEGSNAVLAITDDGIGIDPDNHVQAMGRFSQAKAGPGHGLGLPIATTVMQRHGGSLEILDCSKGAQIKLKLPLNGTAGSLDPDLLN